jgi:hypothetical protein
VDEGTHPALGQQPGIAQDADLLRKIRLAQARSGLQVADTRLFLADDPCDLQPDRVSQGLEKSGFCDGQAAL